MKCGGSAGANDSVFRAGMGRECLFKAGNSGTGCQIFAPQDFRDGGYVIVFDDLSPIGKKALCARLGGTCRFQSGRAQAKLWARRA